MCLEQFIIFHEKYTGGMVANDLIQQNPCLISEKG